jgi:hypothetical protein
MRELRRPLVLILIAHEDEEIAMWIGSAELAAPMSPLESALFVALPARPTMPRRQVGVNSGADSRRALR